MARILAREVISQRVSEMFFKVSVQAVILFGSETWVMTSRMGWALGSFYHRFARQISGRAAKSMGGWGMGVTTTGYIGGGGGF